MASPRLAASLPVSFELQTRERTTLLHEVDHSGWARWLAKKKYPEQLATSGWVFGDMGMLKEAAVAVQGIALGPFALLDELISAGRLVCLHPGAMESPDRYFMTVSPRSLSKPGVRLYWNWFGQHGLPPFNTLMDY